MGQSVSRIEKEFILASLVDMKAPMEMRYRNRWLTCRLGAVEGKNLLMTLDKGGQPQPNPEEEVNLFFKFRGTRMTFRTKILSLEDTSLVLRSPQGIFRDLSRGYERVAPTEDMRITFMIQGQRIELDFPKTVSYDLGDATDEPVVTSNFDASKITRLLAAFREKAQGISSENKIIMFRERRPETFEEKLIAYTGKVFLYPQSMSATVPEKDLILSPRVLSREELILSQTNQGVELFTVLNTLVQLNGEKEKKGILQELYSPILYQNYIIGYLYLVTFKEGGRRFSQKVVDFLQQFGRLLAYSLKVNGYFRGEPVKDRVDKAEVIDISASGIQFCLPLQEYDAAFLLFADLEFTLHIGNRDLSIGGRIMRKFNDQGRLYIGIMFLDIAQADRLFLLELLYGATDNIDLYPSSEEWSE